ncbi:MAG: transposase, partial [Ornithinibacter sp.]
SVVARVAIDLVRRIRELTLTINDLEGELDQRTAETAPNLRAVHGLAGLSAAKVIGEVAGIDRFRSRHAFARHNGTAPTPVWSSNSERHRLSKTGNRQLTAATHRIALTQAPVPARGPRLPREARSGRSHPQGSPPQPEETDLRRHLPSNARRRSHHRTRQLPRRLT